MYKIAFLFLIISRIRHESYWKDFFSENEQYYSVYIHAKNEMPLNSYLKEKQISSKAKTTWENTMYAQIELLREALKNPENEKFIFVSESTIPLKSFEDVYISLLSSSKSHFWFTSNPFLNNNKRNLMPILPEKQHFNFQWIILNRFHAQLLVEDKDHQLIMQYECDNEHYPSTVLANHNQLKDIIPQDTTFVVWPMEHGPHPITFTDLNDNIQFNVIKQGIKEGYFFARKFAQDCSLSLLDKFLPYRGSFDQQKYERLLAGEDLVTLYPAELIPCKTCGILPLACQNIFPISLENIADTVLS